MRVLRCIREVTYYYYFSGLYMSSTTTLLLLGVAPPLVVLGYARWWRANELCSAHCRCRCLLCSASHSPSPLVRWCGVQRISSRVPAKLYGANKYWKSYILRCTDSSLLGWPQQQHITSFPLPDVAQCQSPWRIGPMYIYICTYTYTHRTHIYIYIYIFYGYIWHRYTYFCWGFRS